MNKIESGDERVMIFIDLANTEQRVRKFQLKNLILDYMDLCDSLTGDRRLVKAIVYDSSVGASDNKWYFLRALENIGLELEIRTYLHSDIQQKEVDVAMATGMLSEGYRNSYDTAVVVSGDRDFVPAIEDLKRLGKRVEVASFMNSASHAMIESSDHFINLDKLCIFDPSRCTVLDKPGSVKMVEEDQGMTAPVANTNESEIMAHGDF